jgi:peptidoglycan/xylan/chitin deacetylase (PgdA/CDA1 family)
LPGIQLAQIRTEREAALASDALLQWHCASALSCSQRWSSPPAVTLAPALRFFGESLAAQHAMVTYILSLIKMLGGFRVARFLTRRDLRILAYHGFAVDDEHEFRPALFMTRDTFAGRLDALVAGGYPVLSLDESVRRREAGTLPPSAVVITIDDGFYGTLVNAVPELVRRNLPATVYLTTYHVEHQVPVFGITLHYLLWKSARPTVDFSGLGLDGLVAPAEQLAALDKEQRQALIPAVTRYAVTRCTRAERQTLLAALAARCDVDFDAINGSRMFHMLTPEEVRHLCAAGLTVELHTHRHRSWGIEELAIDELRENRERIEAIVGTSPEHFCYPSGRYDRYERAWLQAAGVRSATTCVPGFVRPGTSPFLLGRFVDGMTNAPIVFEAELAGVLELYRRLRRFVARRNVPFIDDPSEGRPLTLPPATPLQSVVQ